MAIQPTYADLGVVEHSDDRDPLSYWRAHFYDDKTPDPIELMFEEEPEHRAIEELMERTASFNVAIFPPMLAAPQNVEEAEARLLAVARGMKSVSDPEGIAALVTAGAAYQSLYRTNENAEMAS